MGCKLNLQKVARQIVRKSYTGAASTAIGSNYNYAYTLSDTVDDNHFWEVLFASVVILGGSGTAINRAGLWLLPPGKLPAANSVPYHNDPFFAGSNAADCNGPPVGNYAVRVDEQNAGLNNDEFSIGTEVVCVKTRKLLVPPGCTLMAYGGGYGLGQGGSLTEQFNLNIWYVQGQLSTDDGDMAY